MLKSVDFIYDLLETKTFQNLGIKLHNIPVPLCKDLEGDEYKKCNIRKYSISTQDPTGGASIGRVVDENLKVLEVDNLRICDPSIVPYGFAGPTRSLSAMLGEKCADMIKEECGVTLEKC